MRVRVYAKFRPQSTSASNVGPPLARPAQYSRQKMRSKFMGYVAGVVILSYTTAWASSGLLVGLLFCLGSSILFAHIVALGMGTTIFSHLSYIFERWGGVELVFTGDKLPERENVLLLSNHVGYTDWMWLLGLAARKGRTGGCLKFFVKKWVKYVPGFGWGLQMTGCMFVARKWEEDAKLIEQTFRRVRSQNLPFWIVSFAEGTLLEPDKVAASQAFARKSGLPVLHNLLLPRTKGVVATLQSIPDLLDAVYDVTIGYETPVSVMDVHRGDLRRRVHLHVKRYPIASLPTDGKAITQWCIDRWVAKEQMLEDFKKTKKLSPAVVDEPFRLAPHGVTWGDTWRAYWHGPSSANSWKAVSSSATRREKVATQ